MVYDCCIQVYSVLKRAHTPTPSPLSLYILYTNCHFLTGWCEGQSWIHDPHDVTLREYIPLEGLWLLYLSVFSFEVNTQPYTIPIVTTLFAYYQSKLGGWQWGSKLNTWPILHNHARIHPPWWFLIAVFKCIQFWSKHKHLHHHHCHYHTHTLTVTFWQGGVRAKVEYLTHVT